MTLSLRRLVSLLLLLALATPAVAKDAPPAGAPGKAAPAEEGALTMAQAETVRQRNLQLFMSGHQAGGVSMRLGKMKDGSVLLESRFVIEITRGNGGDADKFRIETSGLELIGPDGRTRWIRSTESEAGQVKNIQVAFKEQSVVVDFEGPGTRSKRELVLPENEMTDYRAFKTLLPRFEKEGKAQLRYVTLEAEEASFEPHEMTIVGRKTIEHGGKTHEGYEVRAVSPTGPATMVVDEDFLPMHLTMMGIIEAKWTDGSPFEFSAGGWEISSFIPVEGFVPMETHIQEMEVLLSFERPVEGDKPLLVDNRYQKVRKEGDAIRLTLASTRLPDDAPRLALPLASDDPEVKRFLDATPQSQSDHPTITAKAKAIVGTETDALTATAKIVLWVYQNLEKRGGARGNATAVEVLKDGLGDCSEHAALTVALCRAVGIPARNAGGIVYVSTADGQALGGYHAWSEVWLGRWVAVDATIPEVGTSARYILFDIDEPGMSEGKDRLPRVLGADPRLTVQAFTPRGGTRTEVAEKK
jgi:hypothetical protein